MAGVGHVLAGSVFVFGSGWINKVNRILLLLVCLLSQFIGFVLIFINIPKTSNQAETYEEDIKPIDYS